MFELQGEKGDTSFSGQADALAALEEQIAAHREHERCWERGWDGHTEAQRLRLARLPLAEKLRWLEEAHALVRQLQRRRAEASGDVVGADRDSKES